MAAPTRDSNRLSGFIWFISAGRCTAG